MESAAGIGGGDRSGLEVGGEGGFAGLVVDPLGATDDVGFR